MLLKMTLFLKKYSATQKDFVVAFNFAAKFETKVAQLKMLYTSI